MLRFEHMHEQNTGANLAPQVPRYPVDRTAWLTVAEAVIRCTDRGLSRTPKTIRKWAARSFEQPEAADILVRREDTGNGFRWSIEATTLERKIDEELEYEAQRQPKPDATGVHLFEHVGLETTAENLEEPVETPSEPVPTSTESSGGSGVEAELRHQLEQSRAEVEFLRDELVHRRQTDKALGTVIEAFKLNAETTRSQLATPQTTGQRNRWDTGEHDIVPSHREAPEQ